MHSGLMAHALDSIASAPGLSPGQGHCEVFLAKTLYSQIHSFKICPEYCLASLLDMYMYECFLLQSAACSN